VASRRATLGAVPVSSAAIEGESQGIAGWRPRVSALAPRLLVAAVVALFLVNGARYAYETQRELRLIPWLAYDDRVDFNYFYAGAQLALHGEAADLYPQSGEPSFPQGDPIFGLTRDDYARARLLARGNYYNPPALAFLQAPLAGLPFRSALWLFSALSLGALAGFLALCWRAGRGVWEMPLLVMGILSFGLVHEVLIMGHPTMFLLLALGGGLLALRSGRPVLAGLALSLLALKPQWAVLPALFLLVRGEWRALATMAIASTALFFLPFLATGLGALKSYVQFIREASAADVGAAPQMFSWNGFLYKLNGSAASPALIFGLMAVTLLPLLAVWRSRDFYLGGAATIVAMLLLSLHSVWYDWAFLAVAALLLTLRPSRPAVRVQGWAILLALYLASSQSTSALLFPGHHFIDWERPAFYSLTLVAFMALVWMAAVPFWDRAADGAPALAPAPAGVRG